MHYITSLFVIILMTCTSATSLADDVRMGRYTTVLPAATTTQSDLLSVVINISFAPSITTVGEAMAHLLVRSGYRLAAPDASDPYLPILLEHPLPQVHRHLGPIKLDDALVVLAGPAWRLVVDPVNRLISYELLNQYRTVRSEGK